MHTYIRSPQGQGEYIWVVGFRQPSETVNDWTPLKDFNTEIEAAAYVNYLNGGDGLRQWRIE